MARILVIGAHPDDCDLFAGGTAILWRRRGDVVRFVSMTNGDAGHHSMEATALAARRQAEAQAAGAIADVEYEVLDHHDGQLEPTLERRMELIRLIRGFRPDLVLTHRPNDYHPDHRYTSILVQDAAYMVTVPMVCPGTPHLSSNPVFGYLHDSFQKPNRFVADVVVNVEPAMDLKWEMLHAHSSQFYEWLPYNDGTADEVPSGEEERRAWLRCRWRTWLEEVAQSQRSRVSEIFGEAEASRIRYAEVFELSEYGRQPTTAELLRLFPCERQATVP